MASVITGMNPTAPIRTEADAEAAAKASAISIFIGVIAAGVSIAWSLANPAAMQDAVASAAGTDVDAGAAAQFAIYFSGALAVIQLIFGIIQWRNPGKWIAILFLVLLAFGILNTAATPLLAGMVPNAPVIPTWQIAVSLVVMVVQVVLHVAGLRGINKLEKLQMDAAR